MIVESLLQLKRSIYSLDQEEQGEVIMAEYREGWAARAEKVRKNKYDNVFVW